MKEPIFYVKSAIFPFYVSHGFFGRQGGISHSEYASLNCGFNTPDEVANIIQNRKYALSAICQQDYPNSSRGIAEDKTEKILIVPSQIHSNRCVFINSLNSIDNALAKSKKATITTNISANITADIETIGEVPSEILDKISHTKLSKIDATNKADIENIYADAVFTDQKNIATGVLTADCLPILILAILENRANIFGVIHAGWRGAFSGIIENAITLLMRKKAVMQNIFIAIGPGISKETYQVKTDFYEKFITQNIKNRQFFTPTTKSGNSLKNSAPNKNMTHKDRSGKDGADKDGEFLFDLKEYARQKFIHLGIMSKNIDILPYNSFTMQDKFFSHRHASQQGKNTGRQISIITAT